MLNALNRLIVIFGLTLAIICLPILIFMLAFIPGQVADTLRQIAGNVDSTLASSVNFLGLGLEIRHNALVAALACLLLLAFCLLLLWREVRPERARTVKVQKSGGEADVSIESIARRLEHHIGGLADVFEVKPAVNRKGKGVAVELDVEISPEIDVPVKEEEIRRLTGEIIEERMGLKLNKLTIHISYPKPGRGSIWERMPKTFGRLIAPVREAGEVPLIPPALEARPSEEPVSPPPAEPEEIFPPQPEMEEPAIPLFPEGEAELKPGWDEVLKLPEEAQPTEMPILQAEPEYLWKEIPSSAPLVEAEPSISPFEEPTPELEEGVKQEMEGEREGEIEEEREVEQEEAEGKKGWLLWKRE
ncbi:MAG: hypothetical protein ACUVV0_15735 [Anaerolineae bacterium]